MIFSMIAATEDENDHAFMLSLYNDYYRLVRKTIYGVTHDPKDIEDLINDTFLKLLEKTSLMKTLTRCQTVTYVVCTARSIAINFIRHRDVEKKHTFLGGGEDLSESLLDPENILEDRIVRREELNSLSSAVLKLPEKQRDLLYAKYIFEKNDAEIAKTLGISPDSVRQYLTRARREARRLMEKEMSLDAGI